MIKKYIVNDCYENYHEDPKDGDWCKWSDVEEIQDMLYQAVMLIKELYANEYPLEIHQTKHLVDAKELFNNQQMFKHDLMNLLDKHHIKYDEGIL